MRSLEMMRKALMEKTFIQKIISLEQQEYEKKGIDLFQRYIQLGFIIRKRTGKEYQQHYPFWNFTIDFGEHPLVFNPVCPDCNKQIEPIVIQQLCLSPKEEDVIRFIKEWTLHEKRIDMYNPDREPQHKINMTKLMDLFQSIWDLKMEKDLQEEKVYKIEDSVLREDLFRIVKG